MRHDDERAPRRRRNAEAYVFAALVFVSFSTLLISTRSFVLNVGELGLSLFSGVRSGITAVSSFASRTVLSVKELANLRKEYAELLVRVERYETLERDAADIRRENLRLREQLGFSETIRYRHVPARVVGRDPDNLFSAFVIDKGARHGIRRNMTVIAYQDGVQGLVGKIVQVGRSESLVMPIYDVNAFVASRMIESRYEGIVAGQGNADLPLVMRYIKKRAKEDLHFGDAVSTSGMGGIYPKDLIIGRVSNIIFKEYETSLEVELEPAIDFSRIEYVFAVDVESTEGIDG
jgi:rod shape-determining protein MreC